MRDCEREAEKEIVREKGNKACDGSRDRNMGSHREEREGGAAAIIVAVGSWSWGVWPASHWAGGEAPLLASNSLHQGTQSMEANSSLGSTPHL